MPTCCDDEKDKTVNIDPALYDDPYVENEAKQLVEYMDDLIIDLTLDDLGDLTALDAESLEQDILFPAMEAAL